MNILKKPSNIFGLKYIPWFEEESDNYVDSSQKYDRYCQSLTNIPLYHDDPTFTQCNYDLICDYMRKHNPQSILEIGVVRDDFNLNSTKAILDNKSCDATYVGIDSRYVPDIYNWLKKQYFFQSDSKDQQKIRLFLKEMNISSFDFIFIDGYHSMDYFLNDWTYTDMLTKDGTVMFHDTNHHPGPREFFDAIDENIFEKSKHCLYDYGMGVVKRK